MLLLNNIDKIEYSFLFRWMYRNMLRLFDFRWIHTKSFCFEFMIIYFFIWFFFWFCKHGSWNNDKKKSSYSTFKFKIIYKIWLCFHQKMDLISRKIFYLSATSKTTCLGVMILRTHPVTGASTTHIVPHTPAMYGEPTGPRTWRSFR